MIFGFKHSLEFIFIVDCLLCLALIAQGAIMMASTRKVTSFDDSVSVNESEDLPAMQFKRMDSALNQMRHQNDDKYTPARRRFHSFLTLQVIVFFLNAFSAILHLVLIFRMHDRHKKIKVSFDSFQNAIDNKLSDSSRYKIAHDPMAVEYAKLLMQNQDGDEQRFHKLKVFLYDSESWSTSLLETLAIFALLIALLVFSNKVFQKFYMISGRLIDHINLSRSKTARL